MRYALKKHTRKRKLSPAEIASDPAGIAAKLFARGYLMHVSGEEEEAQRWFRRVIHTFERWRVSGPGDGRDAVLAGIALRHGAKLIKLRSFGDAHSALSAAVLYAEQAQQYSASSSLIEILAAAQGWRALAQRFIGSHEAAKATYERSAGLWRMLIVFARNREQRNNYRRALAAVLFGTAKNLRLLGQHAEADRAREESNDLFRKSRQQP